MIHVILWHHQNIQLDPLSTCSRLITGDKNKFVSLKAKEGGCVTYRDNNKGKILGICNIGNLLTTLIGNVLFVDGLKHKLLNISQFCDNGYKIIFNKDCFTISNPITNQIEFVVNQICNSYMIIIDCVSSSSFTCLT